ncbi:hypothetical protein [Erythrobacter tepidarius]|uniref:hypothetical protein n=1 Tax=Erythrobacter tepidarius TaxID=60454 RepID=UPI000A3780A9|nr:hypothetical protein [Erythrobacter tepidarius]
MTKPDRDDLTTEPTEGAVLLRQAGLGLGGGIALIFIAGMISGYVGSALERGGPDLFDGALIAGVVLLAGLVALGMWWFWPRSGREPVAPRVQSARRLVVLAIALGLPFGFLLGLSEEGSGTLFSNAPVSAGIAAISMLMWLILGPLITWLWWQKIDEHEAGAYREGALVAAHAYLFITPAWWLASRAGWLPQIEPMLMLVAVAVIWSAVWFVRRYF